MKKVFWFLFFMALVVTANAQRIPDLNAILATADDDLLYIVDVSDTTGSADGTGKKATVAQITANLVTGINWDDIGGTQSDINVSGFTNDSGYITNTNWDAMPTIQNSAINWDDIDEDVITAVNWDFYIGGGGLWTEGASDAIYYNDGNVGIGTSEPSAELEVTGTIQSENSIIVEDWKKVLDSPELGGTGDHEVFSMVEYDGKLFIGYFDHLGTERAELWVYDPNTQVNELFYQFGTGINFRIVSALAVFNGELYAGLEGTDAGSADIYKYDKSADTWSKVYENTDHNGVFSMKVFNNALYAGLAWGTGDGDIIYSANGTDWSVAYESTDKPTLIESMEVCNGILFAGGGASADEDAIILRSTTGTSFTTAWTGASTAYRSVVSMKCYDGKLYVGMSGSSNTGDVYVADDILGSAFTISYDNQNGNRMHSLEVYNGRLFAGNGNALGQNDIFVFDGVDWSMSFDGSTEREVFRMLAFNGSLYAGMGFNNGMATVYRYTENFKSQADKNNRLLNKIQFDNQGRDEKLINVYSQLKINTTGSDSTDMSTAPLIVGSGDGSTSLILNGSLGNTPKNIEWRAGGLRRWRMSSVEEETGSGNAGSNIYMQSYNDAGSAISGSTFFLERATRRIGLGHLWSAAMQAHVQIKGSGTGTGLSFLVENSSGTDNFAVRDDGNVGIGNTAPSQKLEVSGTVLATGGNFTSTLKLPTGTTLPATCTVGQIFHDTDSNDCADTGSGDGALCICKSTNTWALIFNF